MMTMTTAVRIAGEIVRRADEEASAQGGEMRVLHAITMCVIRGRSRCGEAEEIIGRTIDGISATMKQTTTIIRGTETDDTEGENLCYRNSYKIQ